jgi:DNA-binding MarR family transcriptional regulator
MQLELGSEKKITRESQPSRVAELFLEVIPTAMKTLRRELRACSPSANLTMPQYRILAHLYYEPANNKALAENLGVSLPAASRAVKSLVGRKLVESTQNLLDKREVRLRLTKAGQRKYELISEALREGLTARFEQLDAASVQQIQIGLSSIQAVLGKISIELDTNRH